MVCGVRVNQTKIASTMKLMYAGSRFGYIVQICFPLEPQTLFCQSTDIHSIYGHPVTPRNKWSHTVEINRQQLFAMNSNRWQSTAMVPVKRRTRSSGKHAMIRLRCGLLLENKGYSTTSNTLGIAYSYSKRLYAGLRGQTMFNFIF